MTEVDREIKSEDENQTKCTQCRRGGGVRTIIFLLFQLSIGVKSENVSYAIRFTPYNFSGRLC